MNTTNVALLFSCFALSFLPAIGFTAPVNKPAYLPKAGAWSQVVDGLQGRLLVKSGGKINGTNIPDIYLELRNVANLMNPVDVYYGNGEGLRMEVTDSRNKKIAPDTSYYFDAVMTPPYGIVLPHDSSLRFLVSVAGYGIPKNIGIFLEIGTRPGIDGPIVLPNNAHGGYFLQGTFTAMAVKKSGSQGEWHGTLNLPKVNLTPLFAKP